MWLPLSCGWLYNVIGLRIRYPITVFDTIKHTLRIHQSLRMINVSVW